MDEASKIVFECVKFALEPSQNEKSDSNHKKISNFFDKESVKKNFHKHNSYYFNKVPLPEIYTKWSQDEDLTQQDFEAPRISAVTIIDRNNDFWQKFYGKNKFANYDQFAATDDGLLTDTGENQNIYRKKSISTYSEYSPFNHKYCNFCKKNGEMMELYSSHPLYDINGAVSCPILKICVCKSCGLKGHTVSHCPRSRTNVLRLIHQFNTSPI